ncbi:ankyrin repeat domain-containing protein [Treponema sp.]|uniref:ankyrin repeat domain-containing protein n=1 Tax=Treponema sp. TaxID=166 RepID=UPI002A82B877|nr:ankyrin repeat domain-containing protein [Treponema sp.]MDY4131836.1 ankyrin repeat domain-containing protein [Treponema sp.]
MQKPIFLKELITEIKQGNSLSKLKLQAWFIRYVEETYNYKITYEIDKEDEGWNYRLIDMYSHTGDMEKDYKLAFNYYLDNAEQGDSEIKCNLGIMYKIGKGTKRDFQKALYWFTKASEEGYEKAKYQIGNMYEYGEGVKQNYLKALDYYIEVGKPISKNTIDKYKEIAENGDSELQYKLGYMYENGIGVPKNSKSAFYWYENAANNGIRDANNKLAWFYYCGKSVTKNIDKAIDLFSKHAEIGDASTQCLLANIYEYDECDYENALKWYEKASAKGDCHATHNLALLYFEGEGTEKNPEKAFELLKKAAEQGNEDSLEVLENLKKDYEKSKNKKEEPKSVIINEDEDSDEDEDWDEDEDLEDDDEWYEDTGEGEEETIESDNIFDEYEKVENEVKEKNQQKVKTAKGKEKELLEVFINDISSPELPEERYFKDCKNPDLAFYKLGEMYYYGDFIQQDYYKAFRCYAKATELGNLYARRMLSFMYYYGEGVEKNYEKAVKLYVDDHYYSIPNNNVLYSIFGPPELGDNQNLKKAVEDNDVKEQIKIGKYFYDKNRSQDYEKALEWYLKAAEQGDEDSEYMVRVLYSKLEDYNNLLKWCKKGIEQNQTNAKYTMGLIFLKGYGVEKNILKAKEWYEKAAEDNDSFSQYRLGRLYFDENEIENDYKKAAYWIEKAAENKDQPAINFLPIIKNYTIPVMAAAKDNDIKLVKESIENGININTKYALDRTLLMVAAIYNSFEVAKLLIENGADLDTCDSAGDSAICYAAMNKSYEVAQLLSDAGAKLDFEATPENPKELFYYEHYKEVPRKTPLMYACIYNSASIAELLIQKGVDYNVKIKVEERDYRGRLDSKKITAFEFAVRNNSIDVVKFFLNNLLVTPQETLSYSVTYDNSEIADLALDYGAKVSGVFNEAIKANSISVVKLLIERGAYCGKTALHNAISQQHIYIAKFLLDAGADSNENKTHWKKGDIQFELHPKNEDTFKRLFILTGTANRLFYLKDMDEPVEIVWRARNISMSSSIKACIFSSTYYKNYVSKGLYKIKLEIPGCEKYDDYSLAQVNQELEKIYQDIQQQKYNNIAEQISTIKSQVTLPEQSKKNSDEN